MADGKVFGSGRSKNPEVRGRTGHWIAKPSGGAVRESARFKGRKVREASGVFFGTHCVGPRVRAPGASLYARAPKRRLGEASRPGVPAAKNQKPGARFSRRVSVVRR